MNKYIRISALIGISLITSAARADEPRGYTLTVTAQDIGVIGGALGKQPYSEVAGLLGKLDAQIKAQDAKAAEKPAAEAVPAK